MTGDQSRRPEQATLADPPQPLRRRAARMTEPGTAELDALLEAIEANPEGGRVLLIPITPNVVRWLLRSTFEYEGRRARMTGGTIRGNEFTPYFSETPAVRPEEPPE